MGGSQLDDIHSSAQAAVRGSKLTVKCITVYDLCMFVRLHVPLAAQTWHNAAALLCSLFSDRSHDCCCYNCAAQDLQCLTLHKLLQTTYPACTCASYTTALKSVLCSLCSCCMQAAAAQSGSAATGTAASIHAGDWPPSPYAAVPAGCTQCSHPGQQPASGGSAAAAIEPWPGCRGLAER